MPRREAAIVGFVVFSLAGSLGHFADTSFNNDTYLADAFVHGRFWIVAPDTTMSAVPWHGHAYIIEPVWPAILMLPVSLFMGLGANEAVVSIVTLTVGAMACWSFLRRIELSLGEAAFVLAVLLFTTAYFHGGVAGDVWQFSSVSAVTFTMLLLNELVGRNRPWLVAIFAGATALSRYALFPTVAVYAINGYFAFGKRYARTFCLAVAPFFVGLAFYNYGRFQTIFDRGYSLYESEIVHATQAMFSPNYIANELYSMLLVPPVWRSTFPWFRPDTLGTGMLYTSLVLAFAVLAPMRLAATRLFWILFVVALIPNLTYYEAGDAQFYFRHALDFAPFTIALLALAIRRKRPVAIYVLGGFNIVCGCAALFLYS